MLERVIEVQILKKAQQDQGECQISVIGFLWKGLFQDLSGFNEGPLSIGVIK